MIISDDADLGLLFSFRVGGFEFIVFVTTTKTKCFGCGKTGHLIWNCPEKQHANESTEERNANSSPGINDNSEAATLNSGLQEFFR